MKQGRPKIDVDLMEVVLTAGEAAVAAHHAAFTARKAPEESGVAALDAAMRGAIDVLDKAARKAGMGSNSITTARAAARAAGLATVKESYIKLGIHFGNRKPKDSTELANVMTDSLFAVMTVTLRETINAYTNSLPGTATISPDLKFLPHMMSLLVPQHG